MSHGLKLLLIAAGAIITCIVVVVGFQLAKSGKNDTNKAKEQFSSMTNEYDDVKLSSYDNITISGSEVISCIEENRSLLVSTNQEFVIEVITKENISAALTKSTPPVGERYGEIDSNFETQLNYIKNDSNRTKANYINHQGSFLGSVSRNANGVIQKITFTQQ